MSQKPPPGAQINRGHPLANGIIACLLFNEQAGNSPVDIARQLVVPYGLGNNGHGWLRVGTRAGVAHQDGVGTGSALDGWVYPGTSPWLPLASCTVVVAKRKLDSTNRASEAFGAGTINTDRLGCHLPYSDGTVYWDFGVGASPPNRLTYTPASFGDDVWAFTAGRRGMTIWQNGVKHASSGTAISRSGTGGANQFFTIGNGQPGTAQPDLSDIGFFYMWNRELSGEEIQWLNEEPYAFIDPPAPMHGRFWTVGPAASTGGNPPYLGSPSWFFGAADDPFNFFWPQSFDSGPVVESLPAAAVGTGAGVAALITVNPHPSNAASTGVGVYAIPQVNVHPAAAVGTGVGVGPALLINPHPLAAPGTGVGVNPAITTAFVIPAATGTGVGVYAALQVAAQPSAALSTGVASSATESIGISPPDSVGAGVGVYATPQVIVTAATASGVGVGVNPTVTVIGNINVFPPAATGIGVGVGATVTVGVAPVAASATGVGVNNTISISPHPSASVGTGVGVASVLGITTLPAHASGTGTGVTPVESVVLAPFAAPAVGVGVFATPQEVVGPPSSEGVGVGVNPTVTVIRVTNVFPASAVGVGVGVSPIVTIFTYTVIGRQSVGRGTEQALAGTQQSLDRGPEQALE